MQVWSRVVDHVPERSESFPGEGYRFDHQFCNSKRDVLGWRRHIERARRQLPNFGDESDAATVMLMTVPVLRSVY